MDSEQNLKPHTRILYLAAGVFSFLIGFVFLFLPVLPSLPFFAASALLLAKSSKRIHAALLSIPYAKRLLDGSIPPRQRKWLFIASGLALLVAACLAYWFWILGRG